MEKDEGWVKKSRGEQSGEVNILYPKDPTFFYFKDEKLYYKKSSDLNLEEGQRRSEEKNYEKKTA